MKKFQLKEMADLKTYYLWVCIGALLSAFAAWALGAMGIQKSIRVVNYVGAHYTLLGWVLMLAPFAFLACFKFLKSKPAAFVIIWAILLGLSFKAILIHNYTVNVPLAFLAIAIMNGAGFLLFNRIADPESIKGLSIIAVAGFIAVLLTSPFMKPMESILFPFIMVAVLWLVSFYITGDLRKWGKR